MRILLADDHKVVLQGLRQILDDPEFEIVGAVQDGRALVDSARELNPDIIIADISMPLLNGIEAARQIRQDNPTTKVIFLSMHPDAIYAQEAMKAGAAAYLVKSADEEELLTAIRTVSGDGIYVTPSLEKSALDALGARGDSPRATVDEPLTARQREVLRLLAEGKQAKEIAALLAISARTVEFHKYRIMEILGLRSVPELAVYAARHGMVA